MQVCLVRRNITLQRLLQIATSIENVHRNVVSTSHIRAVQRVCRLAVAVIARQPLLKRYRLRVAGVASPKTYDQGYTVGAFFVVISLIGCSSPRSDISESETLTPYSVCGRGCCAGFLLGRWGPQMQRAVAVAFASAPV